MGPRADAGVASDGLPAAAGSPPPPFDGLDNQRRSKYNRHQGLYHRDTVQTLPASGLDKLMGLIDWEAETGLIQDVSTVTARERVD